jgi:hypothetical protein
MTSFDETVRKERSRVRDLLKRDREDADSEQTRTRALAELEDGGFVNLQDTVTGPTREQLANGEFVPFTPSIDNYTKATVKGMRRMEKSTVLRMHRKGQITDEGFSACIWYARKYEQSGLEGSVGSVDYGKEVFSAPHDRIVFTERQQQAQSDIRAVNKELPKAFLKFFQKIAVENLPVHRAKKFCRIKSERALAKFREMTETVFETLKDVDPEYGGKK